MVASVPELTSRTCSTGGTGATISARPGRPRPASGVPKLVPVGGGGGDRGDHGRVGVAQDQRAPGADQVDVAAAIRVEQVRALAADHEPGVPPTARKARTGELTPPGTKARARSKRSCEAGASAEGIRIQSRHAILSAVLTGPPVTGSPDQATRGR